MVVVAPTTRIAVQRRRVELDGYGTVRVAGYSPAGPARPARVVRHAAATDSDPGTGPALWVLAIDPGFWPLEAGDRLVEEGGQGRTWTVAAAEYRPSDFGDVGYIRVEAALLDEG